MLTDTEKAALVEELAEAIQHCEDGDRYPWHVLHPDIQSLYHAKATACLPIIERVIAERDLDALLDSVNESGYAEDIYIVPTDDSGYWVTLGAIPIHTRGQLMHKGTGPTRTAAVQAAVKAAKEATP